MTSTQVKEILRQSPDALIAELTGNDKCFNSPQGNWDADMARIYLHLVEPAIGWKIASLSARHRTEESLLQTGIPALNRAAAYWRDPQKHRHPDIISALALTLPAMASRAAVLKALLVACDAQLDVIEKETGIARDTIVAFSDLFFNVMDRRQEGLYMVGIVYGDGFALQEFYPDYIEFTPPEDLLMRAGYRYGMQTVLALCGLRPMEEVTLDVSITGLKNAILSRTALMARTGFLGQAGNPMMNFFTQMAKCAQPGTSGYDADAEALPTIGQTLLDELQNYNATSVSHQS